MLKLEKVTKKFFNKKAVDQISFQIKKGEVVGFLGPNGAGKTTTMRMIATLIEPDEGQILFNNKDIRSDSLSVRQRLGYMPENNPLYEDLLTGEYLDFVASLKKLKGSEKDGAIKEVVKETGIAEVFYQPIGELSKGFKQRVGLAQAIMGSPDLLILDEPTEGLDPNQRIEIRNLIKKLGETRTIIISTHVLQEVTATCNRVIIINHGQIVADDTVEDLLNKSQSKKVINVEAEGKVDLGKLEKLPGVEKIVKKEKNKDKTMLQLSVLSGTDPRSAIFDLAKNDGWQISDLHQENVSLEDVFRELTQEDGDGSK